MNKDNKLTTTLYFRLYMYMYNVSIGFKPLWIHTCITEIWSGKPVIHADSTVKFTVNNWSVAHWLYWLFRKIMMNLFPLNLWENIWTNFQHKCVKQSSEGTVKTVSYQRVSTWNEKDYMYHHFFFSHVFIFFCREPYHYQPYQVRFPAPI